MTNNNGLRVTPLSLGMLAATIAVAVQFAPNDEPINPKRQFQRAMEDRADERYQAAFMSFRELAAKGNTDALYQLGEMAVAGQEMPQDRHYAGILFQEAAKKGNPDAQYMIGTFYYEGIGVPKKPTVGEQWLKRAATSGDAAVAEKAIDYMRNVGIAFEDIDKPAS